jgi:UDP-2,3-diacylglucosamine pyrophosphatase LpxH
MIKIILIPGNNVLISKIEEVPSEIGEPDCKLIKPFIIKEYSNNKFTMESWLSEYTDQNYLMIHSDKILTIIEPKKELIENYEDLIN